MYINDMLLLRSDEHLPYVKSKGLKNQINNSKELLKFWCVPCY